MRRFLTGMLFVLTVTAGCLPITAWEPMRPSGEQTAESRQTTPAAEADVAAAVEGNTRFALDLYAQLRREPGNLFFSPYSISTALAMTRAGARGDTGAEMDKTLHFTLPQQRLHPAFATLVRQINSEKNCELSTANALWGQKNYSFRRDYLTLVERYYHGGLYEVEFIKGDLSVPQEINAWAEKQTRGRIRNLLEPGVVNSYTRLVLTNAIYFKGRWSKRFEARDTRPDIFHLGASRTAQAPLMHQTSEFGYGENERVQVLEMPYVGKSLSMVVLLPKQTDGLAALEACLNADALAGWLKLLVSQEVQVTLPKFKFEQGMRIEEVLSRMGMSLAFSDGADFSGMNGGKESLKIGAVVHKAFIETKEEGTEAAAATAVTMTLAMAPPGAQPKLTPVFRADHPFLFLIRDTRSGSILFLGRVADPTR
jgi:serpin B